MEITTEYMSQKFSEYNKLYFNNELTKPNRFAITNSVTYLGAFSCNKIIGKRRLKRTLIEMSGCYEWTEEQFRDIMVHEMIHFYIAYKHLNDDSSHGEAFQRIALDLNENHGLNITARINTYNFKKSDHVSSIKWFFGHWLGI